MKKNKRICFEKQFINRQYNDKWKFTDYNNIIQKLQCNHVITFNNCRIPSVLPENHDVPVSSCKFSQKYPEILAVANENGVVQIENIKDVKTLKYIQTHENTVYDIAWMPRSSQFVTVSGDNSAKLWDCRESDVSLISTFTGHKRSVKCVSFKQENTAVFATGSRDGSLMIWDTRAVKKCAKFSHQIPDQIISSGAGSPCSTIKKNNVSLELLNSKSVTGLVFQNDNTLISCGSMDRFIRVWDMRKTYSRSTSNAIAKYHLSSPNTGFSYLCINVLGTKLYANCMDSYIYCFNINSYDPDPVSAFYGHENSSFYVKSSLSTDGLYLMSGSSDESAYFWNTQNAELSERAIKPFVSLNSHTAEVTCVEMCSDNMVVVTCSDDGTFRLWNPYPWKLNKSSDRVDIATCYDVDNISTVKVQWKNKRKYNKMDESHLEVRKSADYLSHTKICRFYSNYHSSNCICSTKSTHKKGEKRSIDNISFEKEMCKKIAISKNEMQSSLNITISQDTERNHINTQIKQLNTQQLKLDKVPSKRKLEDDGIEEPKIKKLLCKKISSPFNSLDMNKINFVKLPNNEESEKEHRTLIEDNLSSKRKYSDLKNSLTAMSSPTSNLPNYVEDGTSPYIHKCPKIIQKENDWLTKLRKTYKVPKPIEGKTMYSSATLLPNLEKRKKVKTVEYTLHKYFKVASKAQEKLFASDIQKKSFLAINEN